MQGKKAHNKDCASPSLSTIRDRLVEIKRMIYHNTSILNNEQANLGDKINAISELTTLVKIESSLKE